MGGEVLKMDWLERFDAAVAEGKAEGKAEGEATILVRFICRKLKKGKTYSEIVDELEEEENIIKPVYDVAVRFAPDYDEAKILEVLSTKKTA